MHNKKSSKMLQILFRYKGGKLTGVWLLALKFASEPWLGCTELSP